MVTSKNQHFHLTAEENADFSAACDHLLARSVIYWRAASLGNISL